MNILIACEESQIVCNEFRKKGHNAFSCDVIDASGEHPEYHIKGDAIPLLDGECEFLTVDGIKHCIQGAWDMIIAFPPCTHLCNSGARWFTEGVKPIELQYEARDFFMKFVNANCGKIAIENPVGKMSTYWRKPDQVVHPHYFKGENESKRTCLWLKGLPKLDREQVLGKEDIEHSILNTRFDGEQYAWNDPITAKLRSKTFRGLARAMAETWG